MMMMMALRLMPCCFWLWLCGKVSAPPTFQRALSQTLSHPQAHWTTRRVRLSGKAEPAGNVSAFVDSFFVIYLVLIFLFTVRVHSAENHSSALAHVRIAPHCVCRRLNQTWAETLHSKSTTEREFLTGIALT